MERHDPISQETPGDVLKKIRISKGVSLESIHEATKIPLDVLRAIEEGYTVRTITPFYFKGFTKMYAQYIGVDYNQLQVHSEDRLKKKDPVSDEKNLQPKPEKKDVEKEAPRLRKPKETVFAENKFERIFTRQRQRQLVQAVGGLLVVFLLVKFVGCVRNRPQKQNSNRIRKAKIKAKVSQTTAKITPPKAAKVVIPKPRIIAPPQVSPAQPKSTQQAQAKVTATITAKKQGWLQVKTDGNLVFQSIIRAGETETWSADKAIEISGKSIHALSFQLNGKDLGELKSADKTARRVIITKDGLSVKK